MSTTPSLSVVTFTNDPPHRVAASLALVRDLADEIVVAVDASVDPDTLHPVVDVADRVVRAEFVPPLEANLGWLHEQASCDWVLRLDGDDVVSAALLERLATPGWDHGVTHAYVSYRWLWGGPDRMLAQPPWWPDPALRLIRNVDGIARFPHTTHTPPLVGGAARFLDEPLYHLDLLLATEDERVAKGDRYERHSAGLRIDQGWSVNATYYRPEQIDPPPRTTPLPDVDAASVAAVLAAEPAPPAGGEAPPELPLVTAADRRPPAPAPADAALRVVAEPPLAAVSGRTYTVTVGVTNTGRQGWSAGAGADTWVTGQVLDGGGAPFGPPLRVPVGAPVPAGQETLVRLAVPHLPPPGPATLVLGLETDGAGVHDASLEVPVDVQRGRRLLVVPSTSPYRHLGDDLILTAALRAVSRHLPDVVPVLLVHPAGDAGHRFGVLTAASPAAARPTRPPEPDRTHTGTDEPWAADLLADARRVAAGEAPLDPGHGPFLEPFVDASALLVTPGGAFGPDHADEGLGPMSLAVQVADAIGLPVIIEGAYVGRLERRRDRLALLRAVRAARHVTVRDAASATALAETGYGEEVTVVPDPATATVALARTSATSDARAWLEARGIDPHGPYAVFSLRAGEDDIDEVEALRAAAGQLPPGARAVYLPHVTGGVADDRSVLGDHPWAREALAVVDTEVDDLTAVALVAGAAVTVGSRFHLAVLARAAGVPAVAMVRTEYDATRLVALADDPGFSAVTSGDAAATAQAVAHALSTGPQPAIPAWDGAALAAVLAGVLPPAPRLV